MAETAKDLLIVRLKIRLGYPLIAIEIPDTKIEVLINSAVDKIQPYLPTTTFITKGFAAKIDLTGEGVLDVVRVLDSPHFYLGSTPYDVDVFGIRIIDTTSVTPWIRGYEMSQLERLIDKSFKFINGVLYIDNYYGAVTIEVIKTQTYDEIVDERAKRWVESYALALTKESLGRIRSKYKPSNLPMELDGDTLLSEAATEKETLETELKEDYGFFFASR